MNKHDAEMTAIREALKSWPDAHCTDARVSALVEGWEVQLKMESFVSGDRLALYRVSSGRARLVRVHAL